MSVLECLFGVVVWSVVVPRGLLYVTAVRNWASGPLAEGANSPLVHGALVRSKGVVSLAGLPNVVSPWSLYGRVAALPDLFGRLTGSRQRICCLPRGSPEWVVLTPCVQV